MEIEHIKSVFFFNYAFYVSMFPVYFLSLLYLYLSIFLFEQYEQDGRYIFFLCLIILIDLRKTTRLDTQMQHSENHYQRGKYLNLK